MTLLLSKRVVLEVWRKNLKEMSRSSRMNSTERRKTSKEATTLRHLRCARWLRPLKKRRSSSKNLSMKSSWQRKKRPGTRTSRLKKKWSTISSKTSKLSTISSRYISQDTWLRPSRRLSNIQTYSRRTLRRLRRSIALPGRSIDSTSWPHFGASRLSRTTENAKTVMINWERKKSSLWGITMTLRERWRTKETRKIPNLAPYLLTVFSAWRLWEITRHLGREFSKLQNFAESSKLRKRRSCRSISQTLTVR